MVFQDYLAELADAEDPDADDLVLFVVVEEDAGRDFGGFDDGGVVKAEAEGPASLSILGYMVFRA